MAEKSTASRPTFDPVWESKYASGQANRYPWDAVVSFVFRNVPVELARGDVHVLEVGCGAASNLWFAAREGFHVHGIDASHSAIAAARRRFEEEGLSGNFDVADLTQLPFSDKSFHLVVDRAAITCCGNSAARKALEEVRRVLLPGGRFFFNPYSDRHTSAGSGEPGPDGLRLGISQGSLVDVGQICFYNEAMIRQLFNNGWILRSMQLMESTDLVDGRHEVHAEWRVVAERL